MIAQYRISLFPHLLLIMALTGCKVDSINPIISIDRAKPDVALYGVWRHKAEDELTYVHIGPEFSLSAGGTNPVANNRTKIVLIDHKRNGITDESYIAYGSSIGKQRYLSVATIEDGKPVRFIIVKYAHIDKNNVRFSTINEDALKAAIRAGQIKGTIRGEGLTSEVTITAQSDEIEEFLRHDTGTLFANALILSRVQER